MNNIRIFTLLLISYIVTPIIGQNNVYTWEDLRDHFECPEWFKNAKFGIWAHWGAQSQPEEGAGWYARHMYMQDIGNETWGKNAYFYHCKTYGHPSEIGYKDVINEWKAEKLDADSLMKYFKSIGAKYFMIMANHHDHYDNFDSTYHPWNSTKVGPKKDIVKEFELAAKKEKLPFGVTSHDDRYLTWWLPAFGHDKTGPKANIPYDGYMTKSDGIGKWWEGLDPADLYGLPPEQRTPEWIEGTKKNWLDRHTELITKYDVDLLWFDGYGFPYGEYGKELCTRFYNNKMNLKGEIDALILGKFSDEPSIIKDVECGNLTSISQNVWQGTLTPNSWFYKTERALRHNSRTIIEMLIEMISKNGNLLLNVELHPDGTIPEEHKKLLDAIGKWININEEAIFGSRPWKVFGDNLNSIEERIKNEKNPTETDLEALESLENEQSHFNERTISSPLFGYNEVRFTENNGYLYMFLLNPQSGPIKISSLGFNSEHNKERISSIKLLGSNKRIKFNQNDNHLLLTIPNISFDGHAVVFKIKMK